MKRLPRSNTKSRKNMNTKLSKSDYMNPFRLPKPTELGDPFTSNYLPSDRFTPFCDKPTWEDYYAEVERRHPVRYFLNRKVLLPLQRLWNRVSDLPYKFCLRAFPGTYDYYRVDLSLVDPYLPKQRGYLDPCSVIALTCWKGLRDYVENAKETGESTGDQVVDTEISDLYEWWMFVRKAQEIFGDRLFDQVQEANDKETYRVAFDAWGAHIDAQDALEEEMLLRLMKIRKYLWCC